MDSGSSSLLKMVSNLRLLFLSFDYSTISYIEKDLRNLQITQSFLQIRNTRPSEAKQAANSDRLKSVRLELSER